MKTVLRVAVLAFLLAAPAVKLPADAPYPGPKPCYPNCGGTGGGGGGWMLIALALTQAVRLP